MHNKAPNQAIFELTDRPSDGRTLSQVVRELEAEGEELSPMIIEMFDDELLISGLEALEAQGGPPLREYVRHSGRFARLDRFGGLFNRSQPAVIPQSPSNIHANGNQRREEQGYRLDLDYVVSRGIDPKFVLFFRATQPVGDPNLPKPEYYWTSDFYEARRGLSVELGPEAQTAVILVSSLADIARNGGLMEDVNDDSGVAVRQIGLENYDQREAFLRIPR